MNNFENSQPQTIVEILPEQLELVSGGPAPLVVIGVKKLLTTVAADAAILGGGMSLAAALSDQ